MLLATIVRFPPFGDDGRAQGILHCLPCPLAQEISAKETEQRVDNHIVPVLCKASAQSPSVISGVSDRFVCRHCICTVEKLLRLRKEVEALENEFAKPMKRSAEERGVGKSSSGQNHLEELASQHLSEHLQEPYPSCSGHCFAHFFDSESPCVHTCHHTRSEERD